MLISHSNRFIFIHIYKVAGSSIKRVLWPCQPVGMRLRWQLVRVLMAGGWQGAKRLSWYKGIHEHSPASAVREAIPELFDSYFKFAFVRNPWDWQVSGYHYILNTPHHHQHELVKSMKSFDEFIDWRVHKDLHTQSSFVTDDDGRQIVDFVGRIENLDRDFKTICERIGVPFRLAHVNRSANRRADYRSYYSDRSRELVREAFKEDIERFGYEF